MLLDIPTTERTFDLGGAVTLRLENQEGEGDHLQLFPAGVNVEAVLAGGASFLFSPSCAIPRSTAAAR